MRIQDAKRLEVEWGRQLQVHVFESLFIQNIIVKSEYLGGRLF